MKVVVIAATGQSGRTVLSELILRGHEIVAVARNTSKLPSSINAISDDLQDVDRLAKIIAGADAVVSAYGPSKEDQRYFSDLEYTNQLLDVTKRIEAAVRQAGVPRLIVVGGAGSLWFSPGVTLLDSGHWPAPFVPIATSHKSTLEHLKKSDINWTYFSPPSLVQPGIRTGKFRLGKDDLITDADGKSTVSFEDYAIALVDELEKPAHERARFTIGY